jgi:hypothetical protein
MAADLQRAGELAIAISPFALEDLIEAAEMLEEAKVPFKALSYNVARNMERAKKGLENVSSLALKLICTHAEQTDLREHVGPIPTGGACFDAFPNVESHDEAAIKTEALVKEALLQAPEHERGAAWRFLWRKVVSDPLPGAFEDAEEVEEFDLPREESGE